MTTFQNKVAVEATIAQTAWGRLFRAAMDAIAGCFARRETRATAAKMVTGLLVEVDTRNCWTLAPWCVGCQEPAADGANLPVWVAFARAGWHPH